MQVRPSICTFLLSTQLPFAIALGVLFLKSSKNRIELFVLACRTYIFA